MSLALKMYWWPGLGMGKDLFRLVGRGGVRVSPRFPCMRNFGDHLAPVIVSLLSGRPVSFLGKRGEGRLLSLGSILHFALAGDVVIGSGLAVSEQAKRVSQATGLKVHAVRGPLTRAALIGQGVECPSVYGDPALLLPRLVENDVVKKHAVGLVPHYLHQREVAADYRKGRPDSAVKLINATRPWDAVVREILACEVILSSSLHGLIVAEAYGIPALLWMRGAGVEFKYRDYYDSTGREPLAVKYDGLGRWAKHVDAAINGPRPQLDMEPLVAAFRGHLGAVHLTPGMRWSSFRRETNHLGEVRA